MITVFVEPPLAKPVDQVMIHRPPGFWGEALQMTDEPAQSSGAPLTKGEKKLSLSHNGQRK